MMHRKEKRSASIAESDHFERNTHRFRKMNNSVHLPPESVFIMNRNGCSSSIGIGVQHGPEYALGVIVEAVLAIVGFLGVGKTALLRQLITRYAEVQHRSQVLHFAFKGKWVVAKTRNKTCP
jgi:hypothetical protein